LSEGQFLRPATKREGQERDAQIDTLLETIPREVVRVTIEGLSIENFVTVGVGLETTVFGI
jgi:hypothetical protein